MIDAQPIVFPLVIDDLNAATLLVTAPVEAVRSLVPGDLFEVLEFEEGTAQLTIAAVQYRHGSWGSYNGFSIGARGRPAGVPEAPLGAFILPTLVNDRFGCEAAHRALGMPGSVEEIEVALAVDRVTISVTSEGEHAVSVHLPRVPATSGPVGIETVGYTEVDGGLQSVRVQFDMPTALADPDDVEIELGTGRLAGMLRVLGLPCRPDLCTWGEGLSAVFHQSERVPRREGAPKVQPTHP
jgi:hypothetical protein